MHICIVAPEQFPVPGDGSVEICIWAIARALARQHKVTILSRSSPGLSVSAELEQVEIIRLPAGSPSRYQAAVIHYLQKEAFDIVQVDNRPRLMAAIKSKLPRTPVILFLHSLTFVPAAAGIAASLARADHIIANSQSLRQRLLRRFSHAAQEISVIPLGADLSRFSPAGASGKQLRRELHRLPQQTFTVLFVGRVIPRKGVPLLIHAMRRLNKRLPAHLVIAGRGRPSYIRQLKVLARRLGVSATFLGNVAHEHIHSLYQAADCLVCPSQRHESFGLVNVEAMASGLPVIASNNGGIREIIVPGQNGYLIDRYHDSAAFSRCLYRLARDPEMAARIGAQARLDALRTFDWVHTAARLEKIYRSLWLKLPG
ncbi:putative glycosyltransferase YtcC [Paenibacillus albidus]|uniref:Glycosyltransferase YtcC n=1 Tax=Paenibacillus albidus TaxID=2041023 RepID=A0A917FAU7_9BACL|nr:glycosyltransferase family 4 protein [Paenibacillus albidus]GGF65701.1 putative glycosyltransferase YtcC [Paenibacillus albidus]